MNQILFWVFLSLGVLLVLLGAWLMFKQVKLAKDGVRGVTEANAIPAWLKELIELVSKLPAGDRLIFYGVVLLVLAAWVSGDFKFKLEAG
jgi:hypothetical protein